MTRASGAKKAAGKKKTAGTKKASAATKTAGRKKKAAPRAPKKVDLKGVKKQLKAHVDKLSAHKAPDERVQDALSKLRQAQDFLESACGTTMTIPLN